MLGPQNIVSIFIYRDLKDILQDLQHHCEEIQYERKVANAKQEIKEIGASDYVVYNIGSLADAYEQLQAIIRKEINAPYHSFN